MTQDEIIRMFHEAGKSAGWKPGIGNQLVINYLTHFAALVAAHEREKQAEQEPVAWITPDGEGWRMRFDQPVNDVPLGWTPLYAAPVRTKDLTDEEIDRALDAANVPELPAGYESIELEIARAVIAADREKNK